MRLLTIYFPDGSDELYNRLQNYSQQYHYQPMSRTVRELLHLGLRDWESRKGTNPIKEQKINQD
jgi:hypothetical protein